jgi:predicted phosphohydrolase
MARLFALGDLHLSLAGHKPMDIFGEAWRDHPRRMAEAWDRRVDSADTVLLAGDLSWARDLEEAAPDLAWIEERPGSKILLRGNHDGWWPGRERLRRALPASCTALHHDAVLAQGWVVVGARGWTAPDDPAATAHDRAVFARELGRLRLSIEFADREYGRERPRIALLHYPPWIVGHPPTAVVEVLREAGVRVAVYGHLHGADHTLAVRGERMGLHLVFVAADAVDFTPVELPALSDLAPG